MITSCSISSGQDALTVEFRDAIFTFHAQWLHDAKCDNGSSRDAHNAFCQKLKVTYIQEVEVTGNGVGTLLSITWSDNKSTAFPALWLRVLAPIVAKQLHPLATLKPIISTGWLVGTVVIPEITYDSIAGENLTAKDFLATKTWMLDNLLQESYTGIVRVTNLPEVDICSEGTQRNNLVTQILKRLFGTVFQHSMRGADETFKVATHYRDDSKRIVELPNYDTNEVLLPHVDHAHYDNPVRVQGFHAVEGTSENTFIDGFAALSTLRDEQPELYEALCASPMVLGRVAQFYSPALFQTTVDTAVRKEVSPPHRVKCVRWHPHLAGCLLTSFDGFEQARRAHQAFQEVMRRDTHMLRVLLRPGDLYLWDNFRILHGRERLLEVPRTAVGQTVIEQVVNDEYRRLCADRLRGCIGEDWLVQTPNEQLEELVALYEGGGRGEGVERK